MPGSGRKAGTPNKSTAEIKKLAQVHGPTAVKRLVKLMSSEDERVQIAAIKELLDRGYGKAKQPIGGEGEDEPLAVIHRIIVGAQDPHS